MSAEMRQLAAAIIKIQEQLRNSTTTIQLNHSSIEDGVLEIKNTAGDTVMEIGQQWDGSLAATPLTGPEPPTPSTPTAEDTPGGGVISWDGYFFDAQAMADFARMEVHVDPDPMLTGEYAETLRGTIETPRGGEVHLSGLMAGITYYVRLVCRSTSGKRGPASAIASFTPTELSGAEAAADAAEAKEAAESALAAALAAARTFMQSTDPASGGASVPDGSVWFNTAEGNKMHRRSGEEWVEVVAGSSFIADTLTGKMINGATINGATINGGTVNAIGGLSGSDYFTVGSPTGANLRFTSQVQPIEQVAVNPGTMYIVGKFPVAQDQPVSLKEGLITMGSGTTAPIYFTNPTTAQRNAGLYGFVEIATPAPFKSPTGNDAQSTPTAIKLYSATYAADPSKFANKVVVSADTLESGAVFEVGDVSTPAHRPQAAYGNGTVSGTRYAGQGYVEVSEAAALSFYAPASGTAVVTVGALTRATVAGQASGTSFAVKDLVTGLYVGSADSIARAALNYNTQYVSVSRTAVISGLVRNREYALLQTVLVPAGGATILAMSLVVQPTR